MSATARKARPPLRAGVVGYGGAYNMGRQHLRELQAAGFKPSAVVEIDPARLAIAKEDEAFVSARFSGGRWLTLRLSHLEANPKPGWVEVVGTGGSLVLDATHVTHYRHERGRSIVIRHPNPPDEGYRYYKNIARHLRGAEKLVITPEWSRRPIHILDLAARSARAGKALGARYA